MRWNIKLPEFIILKGAIIKKCEDMSVTVVYRQDSAC